MLNGPDTLVIWCFVLNPNRRPRYQRVGWGFVAGGVWFSEAEGGHDGSVGKYTVYPRQVMSENGPGRAQLGMTLEPLLFRAECILEIH